MEEFYKIWKKYNKFQLTKNEMDLNNQKMKNHPPSISCLRALSNIEVIALSNTRAWEQQE